MSAVHAKCGRGGYATGPDYSDCGCRGTDRQPECARAGCGFCLAAESRPAERPKRKG